ncbi:MAG TPA: NUDIX domain-containing protein [Candidatus Paceibacterota bacterium]|nr:NUDIX domain-containing protein [Candidatus Paceibacterota bacterium]
MSLRDTFPLAVVIGRFQVPRLHNGHIQLVAAAQAHAQCVSMKTDMLIVIGVSPALPNKANPLSFEARRAMISAQFEGFPMEHILPLKDRGNNDLWSRDLDALIQKHAHGRPVTIYGSRDSIVSTGSYKGKYPTHYVEAEGLYSGTEERAQLANNDFVTLHLAMDEHFRRGFISAIMTRDPVCNSTVDAAIISRDKRFVVLGQKERDHGKFRFPGGFFDKELDFDDEAAAIREAREECGDLVFGEAVPLGSAVIDDWRYRGTGDYIKTQLYLLPHESGELKTLDKDDLSGVSWHPIDQLLNLIIPDHELLAKKLLNYLNK